MNIAVGLIVFFISLITLVAEFILYFIFGIGASFSGGISTLEGIAFFFVGLMVLTAAIGFFYPVLAIIATITKRKDLCTKSFLIILGLIFVGYFFIFPMTIKRAKSTISLKQVSVEQTVNKQISEKVAEPKKDLGATYIKEFLSLKDVKVFNGYGQFDVPGYSDTKKAVKGNIKNNGDKSIAVLEITIYFLDSNEKRVGEKSFTVVSTESLMNATSALKPNYSKDFGYIVAEDAPSDWAGKVEVEISKIKFEE